MDQRGALPAVLPHAWCCAGWPAGSTRTTCAGSSARSWSGSSPPASRCPTGHPPAHPSVAGGRPRWWSNSPRRPTSRRSAPRAASRVLPVGFGVNVLVQAAPPPAGSGRSGDHQRLHRPGRGGIVGPGPIRALDRRPLGRHGDRARWRSTPIPASRRSRPRPVRLGVPLGRRTGDAVLAGDPGADRAAAATGWVLPGPGAADDRRGPAAPTLATRRCTVDRCPRRPTGAGRAALRRTGPVPIGARLHATVRWWSAPFPAVEAAVPPTGRILEIGCGHGLFSTYLALAATGPRGGRGGHRRRPRSRRRGRWQTAAEAGPALRRRRVRARCRPARGMPSRSSTCCTCCPPLSSAHCWPRRRPQLAPGGLLLIKEMSPTPRWKARWNGCRRPSRCPCSVSATGRIRHPAARVRSRLEPSAAPAFDFVAARAAGRLAAGPRVDLLADPARSAPAAPAPPARRSAAPVNEP